MRWHGRKRGNRVGVVNGVTTLTRRLPHASRFPRVAGADEIFMPACGRHESAHLRERSNAGMQSAMDWPGQVRQQ